MAQGVPLNLTGQRFGSWLVVNRLITAPSRKVLWRCRCDCGNEGAVQGNHLRSGRSTRCRSCASRRGKGGRRAAVEK